MVNHHALQPWLPTTDFPTAVSPQYLFDYAVAKAVTFLSREEANRDATPECTDLVQVRTVAKAMRR